MHKRKYTKEQLEFYFKKLMDRIKHIPREEDLAKYDGYPSVKAFTERFGSWQNTVNLFGNIELSKRKCLNCAKILIKKTKTHKFCSTACQKSYTQKKNSTYTKTIDIKIKHVLDNKCFVCDFDKILEIHTLDGKKESDHKLLVSYTKRDLSDHVLLCPNHHQIIHAKMARLFMRDGHLVYEEY